MLKTKKLKRLLALLVALVMVVSSIPVFAQSAAQDDFYPTPELTEAEYYPAPDTAIEIAPAAFDLDDFLDYYDFDVRNLGDLIRETGNWAAGVGNPNLENTPTQLRIDPVANTSVYYTQNAPNNVLWAFTMYTPQITHAHMGGRNLGFLLRRTGTGYHFEGTNYFIRWFAGYNEFRLLNTQPSGDAEIAPRMPNDVNFMRTGLPEPNWTQMRELIPHDIIMGAVDVPGGVRVILIIDGELVYDILDDGAINPYVEGPGRIGFWFGTMRYHYAPFYIRPACETTFPLTPPAGIPCDTCNAYPCSCPFVLPPTRNLGDLISQPGWYASNAYSFVQTDTYLRVENSGEHTSVWFEGDVPNDYLWAFEFEMPPLNVNYAPAARNLGFMVRRSDPGLRPGGLRALHDVGDNYFFRFQSGAAYTANPLRIFRGPNMIHSTANPEGFFMPSDPDANVWTYRVRHEVVMGAITVDEGVRLFWMIDGEVVFDEIDTSPERITAAGQIEFWFSNLRMHGINFYIHQACTTEFPLTPAAGIPCDYCDEYPCGCPAAPYNVTNLSVLMTAASLPYWETQLHVRGDIAPEHGLPGDLLPGAPFGVVEAIADERVAVRSTAFAGADHHLSGNWGTIFTYTGDHDHNTVWAFQGGLESGFGDGLVTFRVRTQGPHRDHHVFPSYNFRYGTDGLTIRRGDTTLASAGHGVFVPGEIHDIEFGVIDVLADDGVTVEAVRIILNIDGINIFDYLDSSSARITAPGYMTIGMTNMIGNAFIMMPGRGPVLGMNIDPAIVMQEAPFTQQFTAEVLAWSGTDLSVTWTVDGNTNPGTAIDAYGLLTVPAAENALVLLVTATSVENPEIYATARVHLGDAMPGEIFVAPGGSDSNPGTMELPLGTIAGAIDMVRGMNQQGLLPLGGVVVNIRGGRYYFTQSLVFNELDNFPADRPVTFTAFNNEEVIFSGAVEIPGSAFSPVTDPAILDRLHSSGRDHIQQVSLIDLGIPATQWGSVQRANPHTLVNPDTSHLYVNGVRQQLARYPSHGFSLTGRITRPQAGAAGAIFAYYTYAELPEAADRWGTADQAWASGFWRWDWYQDSMPISIDTSARTIELGLGTTFGVMAGMRYYVFNLLEEVSIPGEWFLDRNTGILYYYPSVADLAGSDIRLAVFEGAMVAIDGAENLNFEGIIFEETSGGAFTIRNADSIHVSDSTFRNMGGKIADIRFTTNSSFRGNNAYDLSKGGIYLFSIGCKLTLTPGNIEISNNFFNRFSLVSRTYTPAVRVDAFSIGVDVRNNVIHGAPHSGILFGGVDVTFAYNELFNLVTESDDAGAIYGGRNWADRAITFHNNLLHEMQPMPGKRDSFGIYLDDNMGGIDITSNIFVNVHTPFFGHGAWETHLRGNVFSNAEVPVNFNNLVVNNRVAMYNRYWDETRPDRLPNPAWDARFPGWEAGPTTADRRNPSWNNWELYFSDPVAGAGYWPSFFNLSRFNSVQDSILHDSEPMRFGTLWRYPFAGHGNNNVHTSVSPFVNLAGRDFTLTPAAATSLGAYAPNFANIGQYIGGGRSEIFVMNDFTLVYPFHNAVDVPVYGLRLMWNRAIGATYYHVTVARDAAMTDIVFTGTTQYLFIDVDGLEYGEYAYYWRVEAEGISAHNPDRRFNIDGIHRFTSALESVGDSTLLLIQIGITEDVLEVAVVGENAGMYPLEAYEALRAILDEAIALIERGGYTREEISTMVNRLIEGRRVLEASRIVGIVCLGTRMSANSPWGNSSGSELTLVPYESITFMGAHMGYTLPMPNYAIWAFRMQVGDLGDPMPAGWYGITLRNGSPIGDPWGHAGGYLFGTQVDSGRFELQKFYTPSSFTNIYRDLEDLLVPGQIHDILIGATSTPYGASLFFQIDDIVIFDFEDIFLDGPYGNAIPVIGSIGFHFYGDFRNMPIRLFPASDLECPVDCDCPHCEYLAWREAIRLAEIAHQEYLDWLAAVEEAERLHQEYLAWREEVRLREEAYLAYRAWRDEVEAAYQAYREWREWLCTTGQCGGCPLCD